MDENGSGIEYCNVVLRYGSLPESPDRASISLIGSCCYSGQGSRWRHYRCRHSGSGVLPLRLNLGRCALADASLESGHT